ncbi:MAG: tRNA (adenine-N1)-methyltransferase [Candidatus Odinarchaeia archaeon]
MEYINDGDLVLLVLDNRRRWLVKVESGKEYHTHKGIISFDDIIGKPYGAIVESSLGVKFRVFNPLIRDFILKSGRATQIIYPKDVGLIIVYSGIGPGSLVVEAGVGSGGLTCFLANFVRPNGKVFGYDIRENSLKIAEKNLKKVKLLEYVDLKNKDITQGIDEKNVDAVILDLATPWLVVPHAYDSLKPSGILVSYSPTIEQVQKTVYAMKENHFNDIETVECIVRNILVRENKTRPTTFMVGHTGYITFGRKIV